MDSRDQSPVAPPPPLAPQSQQQQPPPAMTVGQPSSYAPNLPNNNNAHSQPMITPNSSAAMMQNPRFPFNSAVSSASKPMDSMHSQYGDGSQSSGLGPGGFSIEPARKKRGRPRKYSPDGNIALGLSPTPNQAATVTPISSSLVGHGDSTAGTPSSDPPAKRSRGRPPGSGKKQLDALGSFGVGFTPHVILVNAGEDIASKVMAFSQQGPRTVCILSANGAVCNVTLRQPALSGGTVTYEGRFEIISLSGSFSLSENSGNRSRSGSLSVSLAGSDGRVLGGGVAGMLMAATPVQVIVGSFIADGKKPKSKASSVAAVPPNMLNFGAPVAAASPPSQGPSSESSDENGGSPFDRVSAAPYNSAGQPLHMPMYSNMGWANSNAKMFPN